MSATIPPRSDEPVTYEPAAEPAPPPAAPDVTYVPSQPTSQWRWRRFRTPVILFLLTCASTFLVGATGWLPMFYILQGFGFDVYLSYTEPNWMPLRQAIYDDWDVGLWYMVCVLAILLTHELGHFVAAQIYRVRTSLPYFIPLPISPIGTMGAVIAMGSRSANRRQIFDIGLAGPIAGLIVAVPILWIGVRNLDLTPSATPEPFSLPAPLAMRLAIEHFHPGKYDPAVGVPITQMNAWYMAGWVGLLVTGLNMLPVSQLDGGHVTYALFGRAAHWMARAFMAVAFAYMAALVLFLGSQPSWLLMAVLVLVLGTDHPPTSDDSAPLGWFRTVLGYVSLTIPIFCFIPNLQL